MKKKNKVFKKAMNLTKLETAYRVAIDNLIKEEIEELIIKLRKKAGYPYENE
jgi:hypothetical protein